MNTKPCKHFFLKENKHILAECDSRMTESVPSPQNLPNLVDRLKHYIKKVMSNMNHPLLFGNQRTVIMPLPLNKLFIFSAIFCSSLKEVLRNRSFLGISLKCTSLSFPTAYHVYQRKQFGALCLSHKLFHALNVYFQKCPLFGENFEKEEVHIFFL